MQEQTSKTAERILVARVGAKRRLNKPKQGGSDVKYLECPTPGYGGICSDNDCPCGYPGADIPRGSGYMYISKDVVEFRMDALTLREVEKKIVQMKQDFGGGIVFDQNVIAPILMCEQGAKKRGLNLPVAAADARYWWETELVPLRATPLAAKETKTKKAVPKEKLDSSVSVDEADVRADVDGKYPDWAKVRKDLSYLPEGMLGVLQKAMVFIVLEGGREHAAVIVRADDSEFKSPVTKTTSVRLHIDYFSGSTGDIYPLYPLVLDDLDEPFFKETWLRPYDDLAYIKETDPLAAESRKQLRLLLTQEYVWMLFVDSSNQILFVRKVDYTDSQMRKFKEYYKKMDSFAGKTISNDQGLQLMVDYVNSVPKEELRRKFLRLFKETGTKKPVKLGASRYCIECGKKNLEQARFCQECGSKMSGGVSEPVTTVQEETATGNIVVPVRRRAAKISKRFFLWSIAGGFGLANLLNIMALFARSDLDAALALQGFSFLPTLYATIVWIILIYKMWDSIQDGHTQITPGKAVGFLFIPVFNAYWLFRAIWGFTQEYNKFIGRHGLNLPSMPEKVFLAQNIFLVLSVVFIALLMPGFGFIFSVAGYICLLVMVPAICDGINALSEI